MIDLRSDTVTRPTPEMRSAIAAAEVGDDVFGEDPTVADLETETADLLGKEAAVFVPSGHMGNQIAVYVHTRSGAEIWAPQQAHILGNEQGAASVLSRVLPRTFDSPDGVPPADVLHRWATGTEDIHRARPSLLCMENTLTGRVVPLEEQRRATAFAHEHGLRTHLDGARLWNAAVALDQEPAAVAAGFDTVSVCFSKGLGAPVGSALAGDAATIAQARRARKLLGGAMRQVGVLAAGARHALHQHRSRLVQDHDRAERLARFVTDNTQLSAVARTNMVLVTTPADSAQQLVAALETQGVRAVALGSDLVRLVLHLDIDDAKLDAATAGLHAAAKEI
ncbi:GntG family PLP-dependent aldolase [Lipingzhangella sp. LS1_29]|uniref:GntG family PLP-dependent aldolase n=1 Tax=Lipingzhangella rawalii TaxID=2055835 RepID=A0ABU2H531_9ACTN|nr:GntG family PLP-dependent aldolase [Lipingzhangella rawalii]MDS1270107.1 GntG family PLP-dependent aldolase [Lipingzhangella rawalii]